MAFSKAVLLPYKLGSESARKLAQGLGRLLNLFVRRVKSDGRFRPKRRSMVINYGSNNQPWWLNPAKTRTLNNPASCAIAGNKLSAFNAFRNAGLAIPEFTT